MAAAMGVIACSSDDARRDQFYGSDTAAGFGGPEAGAPAGNSTQSDKDAEAGNDAQAENSDAGAKDGDGSADAFADVGASDAASVR